MSVSGQTVVVGAYRDDDNGSDSGSAYVFTRSGSVWTDQAKIVDKVAAAAGDNFGKSVSVSGNAVVIGADGDDDRGGNSGSAFVFTRSGSNWSLQSKLIASDAAAGDQFGYSVSVSEDAVVVGAPADDGPGGNDSGSAHVFTRSGNNWTERPGLTASDAAAGDQFGGAVSVSGDTVVVGARLDDVFGSDSGSAHVFTGSGSSWTEQARLNASDAAAEERFGDTVSVSGDTVVVGSQLDGGLLTGTGSAYVFSRSGNTWTQQARLNASDSAPNSRFGSSVSISGDTIVVGAWGNSNSGSAYVFTRSGSNWNQQAKLNASDAAGNAHFGRSVSVSGSTVVVGAWFDDPGGINDAGSAYIFTGSGSTWTKQAKLTASDAAANDRFGNSVSISGNTVVVGAYYNDDGSIDSGSVYVFTGSGSSWIEQAKLNAFDADQEDLFGSSVSVFGNTLVVSAPRNDDAGTESGSAYVYVRSGSTWNQQRRLNASDAAADDYFGSSVSIYGDTVVVGAFLDDAAVRDSGSAYVFTRSGATWTEQGKLTASDAARGDLFGYSVSISGDTIVVGAYEDDDGGLNSGSAYAYRLDPEGTLFSSLYPGISPDGDENRNGISNYADYALGGDPAALHDPSLQPSLNGDQLTVSFRNNADDVFVEFQNSTTLLPGSWQEMIPGTDYTLSSETINGSTTTQTLRILTAAPRLFFRQSFSTTPHVEH